MAVDGLKLNPTTEQVLPVTKNFTSVVTEIETWVDKPNKNEWAVDVGTNDLTVYSLWKNGQKITPSNPQVETIKLHIDTEGNLPNWHITEAGHIKTKKANSTEADVSSIDKLKAQMAADPTLAGGKPMTDPNGTPVPLTTAQNLYQPVIGSTSVYYAVALSKDLSAAARLTGTTLSVRYEGPALLGPAADWLKKAGFTQKGQHMSIHVLLPADENILSIGQRALMSMIGASMHSFFSPNPMFERIKKCSQAQSLGL
ncbi:hypothetical protein EVC30_144 [Rhizobium phage RHph_Y1_11]|nr:hypothetical protein EVC30_144 [Rhizobium phage RHph_Y1_11]